MKTAVSQQNGVIPGIQCCFNIQKIHQYNTPLLTDIKHKNEKNLVVLQCRRII